MNNYHNILSLVLPTNEPDVMDQYFMKSIEWMQPLASISTICINFQKPYDTKSIEEICYKLSNLGFDVRTTFSEYIYEPHKVPVNKIRQDTADLNKDSLYYALVDDDMLFKGQSYKMNRTSGMQYIDSIHYLLTHQDCGILMMGGTLFRKISRYSIGPVNLESTYLTSKGFIVKSIANTNYGNGFLPEGSIDLVGSDEEKVLAASRLYRGLYPAKFGNARIDHYEHKKKISDGSTMYGWNSEEILNENNAKFIRENYNQKFKTRDYNVIDHNIFYYKCSIDLSDQSVIDKYTTSYEFMDTDKELSEIKDIYTKLVG